MTGFNLAELHGGYEKVEPGPVSDPNRDDDPEAIVRLVERVVRVSVETTRIVAGLPPMTLEN